MPITFILDLFLFNKSQIILFLLNFLWNCEVLKAEEDINRVFDSEKKSWAMWELTGEEADIEVLLRLQWTAGSTQ